MSARNLASLGILYVPEGGLGGWVTWQYTGSRYLNSRNTALADSFSVVSAGLSVGYGRQEIALAGNNLTDSRDPIAESELGDAQYYRQPTRSFDLTWKVGW